MSRPIPDYGDVMSPEEFQNSIDCGMFTDDDGVFELIKDNQIIDGPVFGYCVSDWAKVQSKNFDKVVWFNK